MRPGYARTTPHRLLSRHPIMQQGVERVVLVYGRLSAVLPVARMVSTVTAVP